MLGGKQVDDKQKQKKPDTMVYSTLSFLAAIVPIGMLVVVFLFCLGFTLIDTTNYTRGTVWWLMVATLWFMILFAPFMDIIALIFGIKGFKRTKSLFAWAGTLVVILEIVAIVVTACIANIISTQEKMARQQEITRIQEEIQSYETYVDLTPFGLGKYKLEHEGDKYLWDVTKPEDTVFTSYIGDNVYTLVYEYRENRREDLNWDYQNKGSNVMCDVYFYEETYIIIPPLLEEQGDSYYWGYIYLCKDIASDADLFDIGIIDPAMVEPFRDLPVEKISRRELSDMLGKEFE
jgi:hypothetical protein